MSDTEIVLSTQDADYGERAAKARLEVAIAEVEFQKDIFSRIGLKAKEVSGATVDGVNLMREAGLHLQSWCGHEKMSFTFWQRNCEGKLPYNFRTAGLFMRLAREMKQEAQSLAEANGYMQQMLFPDLEPRAQLQNANVIPPIQQFFNKFTSFRQDLKRLTRDEDMEKWSIQTLSKFLTETQWLDDERQKAKTLLQPK